MTGWLVETFLAVTMLMLLVLAVRRPVTHFFGAGWAYALWLLPLIRIFVPHLGFAEVPAVLPYEVISIPAEIGMAAPPPSPDAPVNWVPLLAAIWLGGAAAFLVWQQLAYVEFLRRLQRHFGGSAGEAGGVQVVRNHAVDGPLAIGLLRRRIVIPADFASRYNQVQQELALRHELTHHKRGDLWWNVAALLLLAFNWFNPVAWIAVRAFRADQELACDAAVAAKATPAELHDYGCALVKSASQPRLIAACPLHNVDQLKRRLKMMKFHRSSRLRNIGGAAALASITLGGIVLSSPGMAQEADAKTDQVVVLEGPVPEELKDGQKHVRVLVRGEEPGALGPRPFTKKFTGKPGEVMPAEMKCDESKSFQTDVGDGPDGNKVKFFVCNEGGTDAEMVTKLESAMTRIQSDSWMPAEHRTKVLAALQAEIARRKAAQ